MDIKVGDKITYYYKTSKDKQEFSRILTGNHEVENIKNSNDFIIIKIERPKYEVVEEKKDLLKVEEKAFLRQLLGTCKNVKYMMIDSNRDELYFYKSSDDGWILNHQDFDLSFKGLNSDEFYSLRELGLED